MDTPQEQSSTPENDLSVLSTVSADQNKKVLSPRNIKVLGGIFALLVLVVVAIVLVSVFHNPKSGVDTFVDGGNGCPVVQALSLDDFSNPEQVSWVPVQTPIGTSVEVVAPRGSRADFEHNLADDTIVGFPKISQNPVFKDPASVKLFYQGNLVMYATDRSNVYFVHLPNRTAWKGEQVVIPIPDADSNTFAPLQGGDDEHSYTGFAVDKNHVYFLGDAIPNITPNTFRLLGHSYALASDTTGALILLSVPENTTREDGPVELSQRILTPLEATYIKSLTGNEHSTSTPNIVFTELKEPISGDAEIRPIVRFETGLIRRNLPSIYGVFKSGEEKPSVCFAAEDYLVRSSLFYKSHALLQLLFRGKPMLVNVDLSSARVNSTILPLDLGYYSQIIFDTPNQSLWVLKNENGSGGAGQSYSLTKVALDDAIANKSTGKILLQEEGVQLSSMVISKAGGIAAALREGNEHYSVITFNLTDGGIQTVASASTRKSTYVPLFFSSDNKKLFYYLSPYEKFGGPSLMAFVHNLASMAGFGTEAEQTVIPLERMIRNEDDSMVFYLYARTPHLACSSVFEGTDGYNDTIGVYDTVQETTRDLFTVSGNNILTSMKLDTDAKTLSVDMATQVASSTNDGTPCFVEGTKTGTKSISI